jgi:hypothetical protein
MRVPWEPFGPSWRATHDSRWLRLANAALLAPWLALMKARLRAARIPHNDCIFGLSDVGRMTPDRALALLRELRPGVTEIFFHAATRRWHGISPDLQNYALEDELAALLSPQVARILHDPGTETIAYADLPKSARMLANTKGGKHQ